MVDIEVLTMHHKATKYISKSRYDSVTQCQKRALSTILDRGDGRSVESQSRESGEQTSSYEFSQVRDIVINRPIMQICSVKQGNLVMESLSHLLEPHLLNTHLKEIPQVLHTVRILLPKGRAKICIFKM